MCRVNQRGRIITWAIDHTRVVVYETLPLLCIVILWSIAWARGYVERIGHELGAVQAFPALVTHGDAGDALAPAGDSNSRYTPVSQASPMRVAQSDD